MRSFIAAQRQVGNRSSDAYRQDVGKRMSADLEPMPFDIVQNDVRELKASNEIASEALALGYLREVLQPTVAKAGALSSELAPVLVDARFRIVAVLPLKQTLIATYGDYLARHTVKKADIWAARNVELPAAAGYAPVAIGIWDSDTDTQLFKDRIVHDASGSPAVIAFDKYSNPSSGDLLPVPADLKVRLPTMKARAKGFSDLQSNIDSPEASEVRLSGRKHDPGRRARRRVGHVDGRAPGCGSGREDARGQCASHAARADRHHCRDRRQDHGRPSRADQPEAGGCRCRRPEEQLAVPVNRWASLRFRASATGPDAKSTPSRRTAPRRSA